MRKTWTDKLQERETILTLLQYGVAALVFFGVIDLESMDAVIAILQSASDGAVETAEGANKIVGLGIFCAASGIFNISRGLAKTD